MFAMDGSVRFANVARFFDIQILSIMLERDAAGLL